MAVAVFVDGQEGTTGLRIHEYLTSRTDVELLQIDPEHRKNPVERARLLNASDVAFLCLPDTAAREAVQLVINPNTCIIDASTAFRTDPTWVYGLPELRPMQRQLLRTDKRISNPGCHATAFLLLVRPLVDAGLLNEHALLTATSMTGYSGGGKKMIEQYEASRTVAMAAPRPYGLNLAHKHLPEMTLHAGLRSSPVFNPVVGPFLKGLAVFIPFHTVQWPQMSAQAVHDVYAGRYAGERFVRVAPLGADNNTDGGYFDLQGSNDTNRVDLFVFGSEDQLVLVARLDNLGKGASGAAVQSMNIHLGLEEQIGLGAG